MEKKSYQIVMDEGAHAVLKSRAKTMDLKIGQLIENLLASMEFRLAEAYEKAKIKKDDISQVSDKKAIEVLLTGDREKWDQHKIDVEFNKIRMEIMEYSVSPILWTPEIRLAKERDE